MVYIKNDKEKGESPEKWSKPGNKIRTKQEQGTKERNKSERTWILLDGLSRK